MSNARNVAGTNRSKARNVTKAGLARRTFLRGALASGAGVAIGLPMLDVMLNGSGSALANGDALPERFGTFVWGGGILHSAWVPSNTGFDWAVSDSFQPFVDTNPLLKTDYLTLVTGIDHQGSRPGHIPARGICLSASHADRYTDGGAGPGYRGQNMPEPSVDTIVRDAWAGLATRRDSVHLSIASDGPYEGNSSWRAGGTVNEHEASPMRLFSALFGDGGGMAPTTDPRELARARLENAIEGSMLDAVIEDAQQLRNKVSVADRRRVEDHLEGLFALERRVMELEMQLRDGRVTGPVCEDVPGPRGAGGTLREKSEVMAEILANALACDLTRVFSFEWSANQSEHVYSELGVTGSHHNDITHNLSRNADEAAEIMRLIMGGFAYLGEQLRSKEEAGGGNVLDRTLIFGTSEHANANGHNYNDHPLVYLGKACGRIRAGQHWRATGGNNDGPKALLTAVRAVGVERAYVGMEAGTSTGDRRTGFPSRRVTDTLSEIEA
ncbi:MAG: DUF1552 domain-containing protein [Myxococcota bacterium]